MIRHQVEAVQRRVTATSSIEPDRFMVGLDSEEKSVRYLLELCFGRFDVVGVLATKLFDTMKQSER